ncbi:MAG: hypothetical protein ACKOGH_20025 [Alphaproteobacteria bacterium]
MAVFVGGTSIDGIVAIAEVDELDALDILDQLVARSMVVATVASGGTRYGQLETLRQYGQVRLVESGRIDEMRERHLAWMAALAARLRSARGLEAEAASFARFDADLDNLRAAVAFAMASGRDGAACAIVAEINNIAYQRPAWEAFDWVRPLEIDRDSGAAELLCAARGALIAWQLGRGEARPAIASAGELPFWYDRASIETRWQYLQLQVFTGIDPGLASSLLDAWVPGSDMDRLRIERLRLYIAYAQQWNGRLSPAELEGVRALGMASVALARRLGTAAGLMATLVAFAHAMRPERPADAVLLAREAADIAGRLGAQFIIDFAKRILLPAKANSEPSAENIGALRDTLAGMLQRRQLTPAAQLAISALPLFARDAPEAALRLHAAVRRMMGIDRRRDFEDAGLVVPREPPEPGRVAAVVPLEQALADVLAALDRVIASASARG